MSVSLFHRAEGGGKPARILYRQGHRTRPPNLQVKKDGGSKSVDFFPIKNPLDCPSDPTLRYL